jgi:autotransporter translocation and assembly factor TamB
VTLANAAFRVTSTGSAYKNGRVGLTLTADRVAVDSFHLEDVNGRTLEVRGSLGTHELRVGELEIEATARRFEVLRNEFGRIELDGALQLRGRAESPQLTGDLVMTAGELKVDEILQQTLYRPYATEEISAAPLDPLAALNPWDRLALNMSVKIRNSLRLTGSNVQVSAGTPLGLGLDLRTDGNLYFVKGAGTPQDPHPPLYVNGELYRFTGTSTFQSRRFDVDPASSVVFNSDYADPNVDVGLSRIISGVETRIRISRIIGQNVTPELHLSSTPPLDESDIMSLIVFGISTNQLSGAQQQELLVRAGTLAAGMIATPLVQAIQREIGLDVLALEPEGAFGGGPRLTVGEEIAPGLVARFSRQFGPDPYDEATLEYALSRILSIRATFSDAESVNARAPFRRNERAGIDLLFFFSF